MPEARDAQHMPAKQEGQAGNNHGNAKQLKKSNDANIGSTQIGGKKSMATYGAINKYLQDLNVDEYKANVNHHVQQAQNGCVRLRPRNHVRKFHGRVLGQAFCRFFGSLF